MIIFRHVLLFLCCVAIIWAADDTQQMKQVEQKRDLSGCSYHVTPNTYRYRYVADVSAITRLTIEIQANNDVHIALSEEDNDLPSMYEIVIGGWAGTKSAIRREKQGSSMGSASTPGILSPTEFRGFWLSWKDGMIEVGKAGEGAPFMTWTDPDPLPVNYIGFSTGWGNTGIFRNCKAPCKANGGICRTECNTKRGSVPKPEAECKRDKRICCTNPNGS